MLVPVLRDDRLAIKFIELLRLQTHSLPNFVFFIVCLAEKQTHKLFLVMFKKHKTGFRGTFCFFPKCLPKVWAIPQQDDFITS